MCSIKIFEIAKQVAEKGVLSDSFGARNVCKTSDGGYRMIDFGRSTVSMSRASINLWLEETADQLGILDQVRSRIYDENKEATTGEQ